MYAIWLIRGLRVLIIFSVLTGCTYQKIHSRSKPQKLPVPVTVKPEPVTVAPEIPSEVVPSSPIPAPRFYTHKVRWEEETLSHIAKWHTGSVNNWRAIAKSNPELNPKQITIGDTIFIPEDLLTTRKPMPHSFVCPMVPKKRTSLYSPKKISTQLESPKLFEPIDSEPLTKEIDSPELFGPIETKQSSIEPDAVKLFGPIE